jgi:hypothetical protein
LEPNTTNKKITPFKEKLKITGRIALALLLIAVIIGEFIEPHENKFRSIGRIFLSFIFLISQVNHLYKKFRVAKPANDL